MATNNPENNRTFDCYYDGANPPQHPYVTVRITGAPLARTFIASHIQIGIGVRGGVQRGTVQRFRTHIEMGIRLTGEAIIESPRANWVGWSKIGEARFVLDVTNDAGYRPMNWSGRVLALKQLGKGAVVYGSNGITLMIPVSSPAPTFSFRDLSFIGILSKDAVCGTEFMHYFIDAKYQLWKLTAEGLTYLNFSEFLKVLVNPVLFYDEYTKHVLISDSVCGFTLADDRMGDGYANLSGYVYESGTLRVASPSLITYEPLSLTTDILDFGRRSQKTLTNVQVGTDVPEWLEIAYDYRYDIKQDFRSTHWVRLNKEAIGYLVCAGIDFRIKLRARRVAACDVDYLNISFKTTDQRFSRSAYVGNLAISAFAGSVSRDSTTTTRPGE